MGEQYARNTNSTDNMTSRFGFITGIFLTEVFLLMVLSLVGVDGTIGVGVEIEWDEVFGRQTIFSLAHFFLPRQPRDPCHPS